MSFGKDSRISLLVSASKTSTLECINGVGIGVHVLANVNVVGVGYEYTAC